ncbi:RNA polymerase sigma factor [Rhizomonospora bruguierae]|uniref:RNA polymerase sigma factor n=1 Tax=Rhizomonospora bruguierae TaxID=1581705 RepID=UPI001BD15F0D|nr:RNA polymerase sigma factor [Micromonospora sp. NBRC 107566]
MSASLHPAEDLLRAFEAARAGNEAGFTLLWRALNPPLLRYLQAVAGGAAEDVASETWLQVTRSLPEFTGDATAFRVFLFRVGRNRAIDELRRVGRRREEPRAHGAEPYRDDPPPAPDAATTALERGEMRWAVRLLASLPREQAEAVMLRVVAGLDVAETARVLGKRPGAVRVAAMRGLRRLAEHDEIRERQDARRREGV